VLGGAAGFELARRSAEKDAEREVTQVGYAAAFDRMQRRQTVARVLGAVGGAALLAGAVVLVVDVSRGSEPVVVSGACHTEQCWFTAGTRY
jgi:hypothetical protein